MSISQAGSQHQFDVLVIGAGLSGLAYCLYLSQVKPAARIALLCKDELDGCNSTYAQGGIAASTGEDIASHLNDTLKAGRELCHPENTKDLIEKSSDVIDDLIQFGVNFDKDSGGYQLAKEGGHSARRIYHAGDHTGLAIMNALKHALHKQPNIHIFTHHIAVNLIKCQQPPAAGMLGEIIGAYVLDDKRAKIHTFLANATILATGGAGKVYRYTTNPDVATGDGVAMACRSGARVSNMEFYQFHPTLLHHPTLNNFLISEAVRGEGAKLLNADTLKPFMQKYDSELLELAPRDTVARAIFSEIESSEANFVYLDITHQPKDFLKKHFPSIFNTLLNLSLDISKDYIPVVPAAHYQCGGVLASPSGQTDLKRLYAIGEVACTGLHGANRLASNSLLEGAAMAKLCAIESRKLIEAPRQDMHVRPWDSGNKINLRRQSQINAHWRGLRGEMTSYAGIVRTEAGLSDLLKLILIRKKIVEEYYWQHQITRDLIELRNIIFVAEMTVRSAISRRESRGGHYREDYPDTHQMQQNTVYNPFNDFN